jgi:serine/threonine protein kinase
MTLNPINTTRTEEEEGQVLDGSPVKASYDYKFLGCSPISKYTIKDSVGDGTFGIVYEALDRRGSKVALKRVLTVPNQEHGNSKKHSDHGFPATSLREILVLKKCSHKNIIDLIEMAYEEGTVESNFVFIRYKIISNKRQFAGRKKDYILYGISLHGA